MQEITGMTKKIIQLITLFTMFACQNDYPPSVWNPEYSSRPIPVINNIEPVEGSFAGVGVVTIHGEHFSWNLEDNRVYFNGIPGTTLSASENVLTVQTSTVVDDSALVKVYVTGAIVHGIYDKPYKLSKAAVEYEAINNFVDPLALACDKDDAIYTLDKEQMRVIRVAHPDSGATIIAGTSPVAITTGMKIGPGGDVYFLAGINLHRIPAGTSTMETYVTLPRNSRPVYFDFDHNLNIFAAGQGGTIECIHPDKSRFTAVDFPQHHIFSLRIFDGYVYIFAEYIGDDPKVVFRGIWRYEILDSDGNLGTGELYFDWGAHAGEDGPTILSMTFSENGDMYLGMDKEQAITILHSDKTTDYLYPEILRPPGTFVTWGEGKFLYVNRHDNINPDNRRVVRVSMAMRGAPYYGRQ